MIAFFSGYPLLYAATFIIARQSPEKNNFADRVFSLLPSAYALAGTLYLGLQLRNLYPDYSIENIRLSIQQPYLVSWGLLSLLFWIPLLHNKPVLSLIHSLIFFSFLAKDLLLHTFEFTADKNVVRNDMKVYTVSLLLNLGSLVMVTLINTLLIILKRQKRIPPA